MDGEANSTRRQTALEHPSAASSQGRQKGEHAMKSLFGKLTVAVVVAAFALPAVAAEKLVVGAYPSNPPWEAKNEKGEFEGFEVDLVKAIATTLNREVELQDLGFQALFAATSSGRIDMAISTITITQERLKSQAFT